MTDAVPLKTPAMLREEALGWIIRLREGEEADWREYEAWMAADPRAADIYWSMAAADADIADALSQPRPATPILTAPVQTPKRRWFAGAALAMAASILLLLFVMPAGGGQTIETRPGQTRDMTLDDGSRIILNGGSRIELDRRDPRNVRLAAGEARFTVTHDAKKPFRVHVGDAVLVDLGTVFSATMQDGELRVAVADGAVRYKRGDIARDLAAGDTLWIGRDGRPVIGRIDPADVAPWAEGRLAYTAANAGTVAADLSRATGLAISVDPVIAGRSFSGGFALGNRDLATVRRAASLMGLAVRAHGDGWILEAPASGSK